MGLNMHDEYSTRLQKRLARRWHAVTISPMDSLSLPLRMFRRFLVEEPFIAEVCQALLRSHPDMAGHRNTALNGQGLPHIMSETEAAAFAWFVLESLAMKQDNDLKADIIRLSKNHQDAVKFLSGIVLRPLYEYVDEAIEDQTDLLAGIVRFQRWAEFFGYRTIEDVVSKEKAEASEQHRRRRIENLLQGLFFERLFMDGMPLTRVSREPSCAVGRPDFVFLHHGKHIVSDVKLYDDTYGVPYLREGVGQVRQYMQQYATSTGYLIVFNLDPRGLRCGWGRATDGIPCLQVDGRTLYVIIVAGCVQPPASEGSGHKPRVLSEGDLTPNGGP